MVGVNWSEQLFSLHLGVLPILWHGENRYHLLRALSKEVN
jgi:hypothetical protein